MNERRKDRKLLWNLVKNDFKQKFAGSYLGRIWAFVQPVVIVLVYWFAFEKGMKATVTNHLTGNAFPYLLWLVAGIVPWFYFSDALNAGVGALLDYSYLVKKVVFKIELLPLVRVFSAVFVHCFFVLFAILLYSFFGYMPDVYVLQVIYYSFGMILLAVSIAYFTSAVVVFFRDLTQVIGIVLNVGLWVTPIMWDINTLNIPETWIKIIKLNPMYYVVTGYRDAFINKVWFWEHTGTTLYFWLFVLGMFLLGRFVFKRLRVHFADVL
ncbi:MAG: ABC transporter permease [Lachnospiraceae bacterium]|nr:ABC transporter permease [Lachnospiraceae bacterium]